MVVRDRSGARRTDTDDPTRAGRLELAVSDVALRGEGSHADLKDDSHEEHEAHKGTGFRHVFFVAFVTAFAAGSDTESPFSPSV